MRDRIRRVFGLQTVLGELLIVVVGVIIALGLDSLWDQRQERRQESEHLLELQRESAQNIAGLKQTIARMEEIKRATATLIGIVEGVQTAPSTDSVIQLTWDSFSFDTYEPLSTAYDNLLSSGGIQVLRDEELKTELALFKARAGVLGRQDWVLDQWNRVIQPWVIDNLKYDWLPPSYRAEHELPAPMEFTDWSAVLADQEFKGLVINRHLAITDYLIGLNDILPSAQAVEARLEGVANAGTTP